MKTIIAIMILFAISFFCYVAKMPIKNGKANSGVSDSQEEDDGRKDKDKMDDGR